VDGIKRGHRGQLNVVYVDIIQAQGKELAREYGVMGTPTLLLLDSEGNQVNMLRGAVSQSMLELAVEDLLSRNATTE
jgi:thioredoxin-related protein